ncbi:MAG: tetratricopeptide repeat protein, partial [Xanthomonadaceae bacterium]|nr:tetratricopeptide repeat protein [Xanthomonadaceae bacterium]
GREALRAEGEGELERAEQLLERAMRIDARDPAILQQMAELQLARGRFDQAESFASRSFELGPRVGEICQRSLRVLIIVHERNSQWDQAHLARDRLEDCRVAPPERF